MELFYNWCDSHEPEKEQIEDDDVEEEMLVDYELHEALRLSMECPVQQLHSFTEEMHLKRALSDSLSIKQPYFPSPIEKLIDLSSLVKDLFIPILVERGNLKALVSFCTTNMRIYRIYKDEEEKCLASMLQYRILPHSKLRGTYKNQNPVGRRNKQEYPYEFSRIMCYETGQEIVCKWPFVVALCDVACSLKTDTCLYVRENKPGPPYEDKEDVYFHQTKRNTQFKEGICSNEKVRELLRRNCSEYRLQLLMG